VRAAVLVVRKRAAAKTTGTKAVQFDETVEGAAGAVLVSQMHLANKLEFRVVVVMARDNEILPLQEEADQADLVEVYETERHLL